MTVRTRMYFVIYYETEDEEGNAVFKSHSRTSDRTRSQQTLDDLLRAGIKAYCQKEYE